MATASHSAKRRKTGSSSCEVAAGGEKALADYSGLLMTGLYSDVTLVVDNDDDAPNNIKAHRHILSERSEYFKSMFSNGMAESTATTIEIHEVNADHFHELIKAIYAGKWPDKTDPEAALFMTHAISQYGLHMPDASHLLHDIKDSIHVENVMGLLRYAKLIEADEVVEACRDFIIMNHCDIVHCQGLEFEADDIEELVHALQRTPSYILEGSVATFELQRTGSEGRPEPIKIQVRVNHHYIMGRDLADGEELVGVEGKPTKLKLGIPSTNTTISPKQVKQ